MKEFQSTNQLAFHKMHGLGNDFIITDQTLNTQQLVKYSNRNTGIGFDQLLVIDRSQISLPYISVFNANGSRASFCGNGFRCIAALLNNFEPGAVEFASDSGIIKSQVHSAVDISILFPKTAEIKAIESGAGAAWYVDIGNQHVVALNPQKLPFPEIYECFVRALGDINVFAVDHYSADSAVIQCYERGAGLTQACGSGACAVAWVLMKRHHCSDQMKINMPGGQLTMMCKEGRMWQRGRVEYVFEGMLKL